MKFFKPILAVLFLALIASASSVFSMDEGGSSATSITTTTRPKLKEKERATSSSAEFFKYDSCDSDSDSDYTEGYDLALRNANSYQNAADEDVLLQYPSKASLQEKQKYKEYYTDLPAILKLKIDSLSKIHERGGAAHNNRHRVLISSGASSAGKTGGCIAIAHKLDWPYLKIDCAFLGNTYQNSVVVALKQQIEPLIRANKKCIIILDEMAALANNQKKNAEYEGAEQLKIRLALQQYCDLVAQNSNVLLLGTTNDPDFIAGPLVNRVKRIYFEEPSSERKIKKLIKALSIDGHSLDCSGDYLKQVEQRIKNMTFRFIDQLAEDAHDHAWQRIDFADEPVVVKESDIEAALIPLEQEVVRIKKAEKEKPLQERLHDDAMHQQSLHATRAILVQKDLHKNAMKKQEEQHAATMAQSSAQHQATVQQNTQHHNAMIQEGRRQQRDNQRQQGAALWAAPIIQRMVVGGCNVL